MATSLHIDVDQTPAMYSGTLPKLRVRRHDSDEPPPPGDVLVVVSRELPPHLIRMVLAEAAERLCSPVDAPNVRSPYRRNAA